MTAIYQPTAHLGDPGALWNPEGWPTIDAGRMASRHGGRPLPAWVSRDQSAVWVAALALPGLDVTFGCWVRHAALGDALGALLAGQPDVLDTQARALTKGAAVTPAVRHTAALACKEPDHAAMLIAAAHVMDPDGQREGRWTRAAEEALGVGTDHVRLHQRLRLAEDTERAVGCGTPMVAAWSAVRLHQLVTMCTGVAEADLVVALDAGLSTCEIEGRHRAGLPILDRAVQVLAVLRA